MAPGLASNAVMRETPNQGPFRRVTYRGKFMLIRRALFVVTAASAALLMAAVPAAADPSTSVSVRTTDGGASGGTGIFWGDAQGSAADNPEVLGACDKQSDGLRAYANVSWKDSRGWHIREVEDADGAGNGCEYRTLPNITDGTTVYIDACLKNGPNGPVRFCGSGTAVA